MNKRTATWLAWSLWVLGMLLVVATGVMRSSNGSLQVPANPGENANIDQILIVGILVLVTAGALIAARRPENPIGWLLYGMGVWILIGGFAEGYAIHALRAAPGSLPFGEIMAWVSSVSQGPPLLGLWVFVFLLFPNGHLPSARWRPVAWLGVVALAGLILSQFKPGPLDQFQWVNNPFGIEALGGILDAIASIAFWLWLVVLVASAISLVLRFRRAHGEERQQLKWIASAATYMALAFMAGPIVWFTPILSGTIVWPLLFMTALVSLPIAVGIAVLRYRLYDIDIIIRKTLTYGLVVTLLAIVYFGSVILLQQIFSLLTGLGHDEIVTVLSTLGIAALFVPLRNRIQQVIDQRFYRKKYDAQQVLNDFAKTVRDETDLEKLTARLMQVVDETMQPKSLSVWLKRTGNERH